MRARREACEGVLACAGSDFTCGVAQAPGSSSDARPAGCAWHARPSDARRGGGVNGSGGHRTPVTNCAAQHAGAKRQPGQAEDGSSFNAGIRARHRHGLAEALRRNALHECRGRTFEFSRGQRYGAWPARRMMNQGASRAKCHAGDRRLQRGVRRRSSALAEATLQDAPPCVFASLDPWHANAQQLQAAIAS
jgi:hypothetical protein